MSAAERGEAAEHGPHAADATRRGPAHEPLPLGPREARDVARDLARSRRDAAVRAVAADTAVARADALGAAVLGPRERVRAARAAARAEDGALGAGRRASPPPAPDPPPRWGWRRALRFAVGQRMLTPAYLQWYARYLQQRLRHPGLACRGMVFFGRRVELVVGGRLELGAWTWVGDRNRLRCHEGSVRVGDKAILGADNAINAFLDVEVGRDALLSDWIYITDFDHDTSRLDVPIRKQGILKDPVRIGADVWVGEKASILRGADIGTGSVIGSQTVVKSAIPPFSIAVGAPARVVRSRLPAGMTVEEALDLRRRGQPIPGDPLA